MPERSSSQYAWTFSSNGAETRRLVETRWRRSSAKWSSLQIQKNRMTAPTKMTAPKKKRTKKAKLLRQVPQVSLSQIHGIIVDQPNHRVKLWDCKALQPLQITGRKIMPSSRETRRLNAGSNVTRLHGTMLSRDSKRTTGFPKLVAAEQLWKALHPEYLAPA